MSRSRRRRASCCACVRIGRLIGVSQSRWRVVLEGSNVLLGCRSRGGVQRCKDRTSLLGRRGRSRRRAAACVRIGRRQLRGRKRPSNPPRAAARRGVAGDRPELADPSAVRRPRDGAAQVGRHLGLERGVALDAAQRLCLAEVGAAALVEEDGDRPSLLPLVGRLGSRRDLSVPRHSSR